jgi:hypothetical protein
MPIYKIYLFSVMESFVKEIKQFCIPYMANYTFHLAEKLRLIIPLVDWHKGVKPFCLLFKGKLNDPKSSGK